MRWGKSWNPSSSSVLHWCRVYVCVGKRGILLLLPSGHKCLDFPLGLLWPHSRERGRVPPYHWVVVKVYAPTDSPLTSWSGWEAIYFMAGRSVLNYHLSFSNTILVSATVFSDTTLPSPIGLCWHRVDRTTDFSVMFGLSSFYVCLPLFLSIAREHKFNLGHLFFCAWWYFWVAYFSSLQSRRGEAKIKLRGLPPYCFLGPEMHSGLAASLYLKRLLAFVLHILSRDCSCI